MPELFVYLIKVNAAVVLFYLVYHFLLRRLTFYALNRYYLLFAFVFSALYPLLKVENWLGNQQVPEVVYTISPDWEKVAEPSSFGIWNIALIVFGVVVAALLVRLGMNLISLYRIHRDSVPARWRYFQFRHVLQQINPFSFWKNIYVHVEAHDEHELKDIFQHEQVHVEELHTVDTLIAEAFSIICWFNPASWLMRFAVRENLEFITDQRVISSGVDKRAYQFSLLQLGTANLKDVQLQKAIARANDPIEVANHFNLKHLKNRIRMMNKARSSALHLGKYVILVPVIVSLAIIFAISRKHVTSETLLERIGVIETHVPVEKPYAVNLADVEQYRKVESAKPAIKEDKKLNAESQVVNQGTRIRIVQGMPTKPMTDSVKKIIRFSMVKTIEGHEFPNNGDTAIKSKIFVRTTVQGDSIAAMLNAEEAIGVMDDEPVVVIGRPMVPTDSVKVQAKPQSQLQPQQPDQLTTSGESKFTFKGVYSGAKSEMNPLVFIDGVKGNLVDLDPSEIHSIEVFKGGEEILAQYGTGGANGVIKVYTLKKI